MRAGGLERELNAMRATLLDRDMCLSRLQNEGRMLTDNAERGRVRSIALLLYIKYSVHVLNI